MGVVMVGSSSTVVATSNLTYTINLTNFGPAKASNVVVSDSLPAGVAYVSSSASQGVVTTNGGGLVTWTITSMAKDSTASLSLIARPSVSGLINNTVIVTSSSSDPNPDDDVASVTTTVVSPSADLVLGLLGSPNPVVLGGNLTYTLSVTNFGPATATAVAITNVLPPGVSLVSAAPSGYRLVGNVLTFTNVGNILSGGQVSASIVVRTLVAGTLTNSASCGSSITDPLKGNNSASIKTEVIAPALKVVLGQNVITISWPSEAANYTLESAANLASPITWAQVPESPQINSGVKSVTLGTTNVSRFFRLRAPTP
jgi:uncharacterized repeat protein (TIGR01451 family)